MIESESPEFRAARQRTPEEARAVFAANVRSFVRVVRNAFSTVVPASTAPTFAPVAVPDFSPAIARATAARLFPAPVAPLDVDTARRAIEASASRFDPDVWQ